MFNRANDTTGNLLDGCGYAVSAVNFHTHEVLVMYLKLAYQFDEATAEEKAGKALEDHSKLCEEIRQ